MVGAACLHYWVQECRIDDVSSVTVHTIKKEMIKNGFHVQMPEWCGERWGPGENHKTRFIYWYGPHKTTQPAFSVGPSLAHQQNAIQMAFCWWANGSQLCIAGCRFSKELMTKTLDLVDPLTKLS